MTITFPYTVATVLVLASNLPFTNHRVKYIGRHEGDRASIIKLRKPPWSPPPFSLHTRAGWFTSHELFIGGLTFSKRNGFGIPDTTRRDNPKQPLGDLSTRPSANYPRQSPLPCRCHPSRWSRCASPFLPFARRGGGGARSLRGAIFRERKERVRRERAANVP